MNESQRANAISRRAFLRRATVASVGVSAALLVGEEMWEALDRLAPRRLLVPGGICRSVQFSFQDATFLPAFGMTKMAYRERQIQYTTLKSVQQLRRETGKRDIIVQRGPILASGIPKVWIGTLALRA